MIDLSTVIDLSTALHVIFVILDLYAELIYLLSLMILDCCIQGEYYYFS